MNISIDSTSVIRRRIGASYIGTLVLLILIAYLLRTEYIDLRTNSLNWTLNISFYSLVSLVGILSIILWQPFFLPGNTLAMIIALVIPVVVGWMSILINPYLIMSALPFMLAISIILIFIIHVLISREAIRAFSYVLLLSCILITYIFWGGVSSRLASTGPQGAVKSGCWRYLLMRDTRSLSHYSICNVRRRSPLPVF